MENFDKLSDVVLSEKEMQDVNGGAPIYPMYGIGVFTIYVVDMIADILKK
ncbi:MAG: hypothetical protein JW969_03330 [Spirochaetales bacterium]|nr:hypothetical protein [Spirochaetales bacterium]